MAPALAMVAGVLAWLWPIGLGGRMVVGGDATQFSMGLMAFLHRSIRAGRWPLWNDGWGYGFPGLAESQMGVYYPPHLVLFGLLPPEYASVASQVLHTLWGAFGAMWAARRFGASRAGGALAGFAWSTCGFALIHLPHQWAATTGSWMPWAWGLAWGLLRGAGTNPRRGTILLAGVLAVQVLPGHFQLAFTTEVGVLVLAAMAAWSPPRRSGLVALAVAAMLPLAACQLAPTLALARLSGGDRDFGYLSGFAASPLHLVTYLAPGLFHQSPLWRPLAWDPFHMAPEEHLAAIGLVPLFLALGAIRRGVRSDPAVRALVVVAGVATLFSFGPYAPGFRALILLPGFSFFRAPARWELAAALALAILAGRGFDALPRWDRPGRSLARFAVGSIVLIAAVVAVFEGVLVAAQPGADPRLARAYDAALGALPWPDARLAGLAAEATRRQGDLRVRSALARQGDARALGPGLTWWAERARIYRGELGGTAVALAALLLASATLGRRPRGLVAALLVVMAGESAWLGRQRPFDLGPIRPLAEQSPVLARIAALPGGTLSLDPAQNLFQVVGAAPAQAYRTLDLPRPGALLTWADRSGSADALRAAGIGVRVLGPLDRGGPSVPPAPTWADPGRAETIRDPALAGWLHGADLARRLRADAFTLAYPRSEPARAWFVPADWPVSDDPAGATLHDLPRVAEPLATRAEGPGRFAIDLGGRPPGRVVIARTFDPEWRATWVAADGAERPASLGRGPGGWMAVRRYESTGFRTLRLRYDGGAARVGLAISAAAWLAAAVAWTRAGRKSARPAPGPDSGEGAS